MKRIISSHHDDNNILNKSSDNIATVTSVTRKACALTSLVVAFTSTTTFITVEVSLKVIVSTSTECWLGCYCDEGIATDFTRDRKTINLREATITTLSSFYG